MLFPVFMSKIINSFPYAVALAKSMSHNIRKYETWHENPVQVSVSSATLWKITCATTNEKKLLIILLIKTGNNIFWQFFHIIIEILKMRIFSLWF